MLVITKEKIETIGGKLDRPEKTNQSLKDVRKILEIKEALLWRAEVGSCCAGTGLASRLFEEVRLLQETLLALEKGDNSRASLLFKDFISQLEYD